MNSGNDTGRTVGWEHVENRSADTTHNAGVETARVSGRNRDIFCVRTKDGEKEAVLAGRLRYELDSDGIFPTVGDSVLVSHEMDKATIHQVLPRRNHFSRQSCGTELSEQVIASNLDFVLIVMGLDADYNLRRLNRYLTMAAQGGVAPVVILSKADLCRDVQGHAARTAFEVGDAIPVYAISVRRNYGIEDLSQFLGAGMTSLLVGSSGAGKSTLTNRLIGTNVEATGDLSGNGRGRCTTSWRRLYETPDGAFIIDNPGMREIQLWGDEGILDDSFSDISTLASSCRFGDCRHQGEPGCRVQEAVMSGLLSEDRFLSYTKLREELHETRERKLRMKEERFRKIAIEKRRLKKRGM